MTSPSPQSPVPSPSPGPGLSASDRDELALLALKRMKGFERRVLSLMYGLAGITDDADGTCHAVKVIASLCKCSEAKVLKIQTAGLGKLAAVLDVEPVQAGRHLFRMGVHWTRGAGLGARDSGMQFTPIEKPTVPGHYWFHTVLENKSRLEIAYVHDISGTLCASFASGAGGSVRSVTCWGQWYGPPIPEPTSTILTNPITRHDLHPENAGTGVSAAHAAADGPDGLADEPG